MSDNNEAYELAESAASYAGKLYNGLEKIVASMRENAVQDGLASFSTATEGIEWLIQAVTGLNGFEGLHSTFDTKSISGFLAEMLEAIENTDNVLLADLLEYEILPIIDEWGVKLDSILEGAEQ